jgi:uncharacterized Zn finger protein (UPF0148 family)
MRIRGERECKECGTRWSYYETGSVDCPSCGSLRSVGVEERKRHTDSPVEIDLSSVRASVDSRPLHELTDEAKAACREYVRSRGFVRAGELQTLDDEYLVAVELLEVADLVGRSFDPTEDEELYLLDLVGGVEAGNRPEPGNVPDSLRAARGLAYAKGVREYRRELRDWLEDDDRPSEPEPVRVVQSRLDQHVRRIRALSGDVDPRSAERLVETTRDLAAYFRDDDEAALATARDRLERME